MNKGVIVGRLTRNPELRYTNQNKAVTKISIACNNAKDDTTFLNITIFGKMAETVNNYCSKGDLLGVSYIVKNNTWTDKELKKHFDYIFIANKVTFLATTKKENNIENENKDVFEEFGEEIKDEDLPF